MSDRGIGFQLVQRYSEYTDYDAHLPDQNGVGLRIRITLIEQGDRGAYLTVIGDKADCSGPLFESDTIDIPEDWALKITAHTKITCPLCQGALVERYRGSEFFCLECDTRWTMHNLVRPGNDEMVAPDGTIAPEGRPK